jgi:hypothetical protein
MIMKRNPIAITPLPLAGRQLDPNWKKSTNDLAETLIAVIWKICGALQIGVKLNADNVQT